MSMALMGKISPTYERIRRLMEERGVTCPLFASDGPWRATLQAGTLIDDDVFVTGNFGSKAAVQLCPDAGIL